MKYSSLSNSALDTLAFIVYSATINRQISDDTVTLADSGPDLESFNQAQIWFGEHPDLLDVSIPYELADGTPYNHYGYFLKNPSTSNRVVLICHGYTGCAHSVGAFAKIYYDAGFSVLAVDLRGHGRSDEHRTNLAIIDSVDMQEWSNYLSKKYNGNVDILIHGCSLGAGVAFQFISTSDLPTSVKGAIVDSSFQNTSTVVRNIASALTDWLPEDEQQYVYDKVEEFIQTDQGITFEDGLNKAMIQNGKVPLLMIHSNSDTSFSLEDAIDSYNLSPNKLKGYLWMDLAPHARCVQFFRNGYINIINKFIQSIFNNHPLISGCYEKEQMSFPIGTEVNLLENVVAMDKTDGDITKNIVTTGHVDKNTPGIYPVNYSVTNSHGINSIELISITIK